MGNLLPSSPQVRASSRHPTATMSTTRWRYLNSCPASRPSTPVRTSSRCRRRLPGLQAASAVARLGGSKIRSLHSRSKTWPFAFRGRETSGGTQRLHVSNPKHFSCIKMMCFNLIRLLLYTIFTLLPGPGGICRSATLASGSPGGGAKTPAGGKFGAR